MYINVRREWTPINIYPTLKSARLLIIYMHSCLISALLLHRSIIYTIPRIAYNMLRMLKQQNKTKIQNQSEVLQDRYIYTLVLSNTICHMKSRRRSKTCGSF